MLRVLLYGSTVLLATILGLICYHDSKTYSYIYSIDADYPTVAGEERPCHTAEVGRWLDCGELQDEGLVQRYLQRFPPEPVATGEVPESALMDSLRKKGKVRILANQIIEKEQVRYKIVEQWSSDKLLQSARIALPILAGWFLFWLVLYRLALYIAHGHARIRKAPWV